MRPRDAFDMLRSKGGSRCMKVGRRVQTYLDGELDADATAKVARHLEACRRCGLDASDYRRLKSTFGAAAEPVSVDVVERLRVFATGLASGKTPPE